MATLTSAYAQLATPPTILCERRRSVEVKVRCPRCGSHEDSTTQPSTRSLQVGSNQHGSVGPGKSREASFAAK
eukprot:9215247-Alexandrium_andersonii.AAC.1